MMFTVTATIQSIKPAGEPVPMQWYRGESAAKAISAVATLAADPKNTYTRTLSVNLTIEDDEPKPWEA